MRTATTVEAAQHQTWDETVDFVVEAEKLGLDVCWVAEAWGSDAPSAIGYLAARTERLLLGSGIIQIGTRTPVSIAMTALSLARLSRGRFLLGLGASGPQVIEGLHGVPFAAPLTRMRETVEVLRQAFAGEKIVYSGSNVKIPRPDGQGRPMRLALPANTDIPIYLASMSPKMLQLTGQVADGWLGTSFVPEGSAAYFDHLDRGWPPRGAPDATSTSARVQRSRSWTTRTRSPPTSPPVRRSWPSAWVGWVRPAPTSTTTPTAVRAGPMLPQQFISVGRTAIEMMPPPSSPTRWCSAPR